MIQDTHTIPHHVIRTFKEIEENYNRPSRNDWDADKLLAIFQEALNYRKDLNLLPTNFWELFSLVRASPATKDKINELATKLWFSALYSHTNHPQLDAFLDENIKDLDFQHSIPFIYDQAVYFFESAGTENEKKQRRKAIEDLSIEDQFKFIILMYGYIAKDYPPCIFTTLVREIRNLRKNWQTSIAKDTLAIIEKLEPSSSHISLIATLNKIGFPTYRDVIAAAKPIIEKMTDVEEIGHILLALSKIDPSQRSEIVNVISSTKLKAIDNNVFLLFDLISNVDSNIINTLIDSAHKLVRCPNEGEEWKLVITELLPYTPEEGKELCQFIKSTCIIKDDIDSTSIFANILKRVKIFPKYERKDAISLLSEFSYIRRLWSFASTILSHLKHVKPSERISLIQLALSVIKSEDAYSLVEIVEILKSCDQEERSHIVKCLQNFKNTSTNDKIVKLISVLARVRKDERNNFCKDIIDVTESHEVYAAEIASYVVSYPEDERKNLAKHLLAFVKKGINNRELLVKSLFNIDISQREEILKIAEPLTQDLKEVYPIHRIWAQIYTANPAHRKADVDLCLPFISKGKKLQNRHQLFEAISFLPQDEKELICKQTLSVVTDSTSLDTCVLIMGILFSTPKTTRNQLVSNFQTLKEIVKTTDAQLHGLIRHVDPEHRNHLLAIINKHKDSLKDENEIYEFALSLSKISEFEWMPSLIKLETITKQIPCTAKHEIVNEMIGFTEEELPILIERAKPYILKEITGKNLTSILRLFRDIPEKVIQERLPIAKKLFKENDGLALLEIIQFYKFYSLEEFDEMANDLRPYLIRLHDAGPKREIIRAYYNMQQRHRRVIIKEFSLFLENCLLQEIDKCFGDLTRIPYADWAFLPQCRVLIEKIPQASAYARTQLFSILCQFHYHERKEVIDLMLQMSDFPKQFPDIATALFNIPRVKRAKVVAKAKEHLDIFQEEAVANYLRETYVTLENTGPDQNELVEELKQLLPQSLHELKDSILQLSEENRRWIVPKLPDLLENCEEIDDTGFFATMTSLGEQKCNELLTFGRDLFQIAATANLKDLLLKTLAPIVPGDLELLIEDCKTIIRFSADITPDSLIRSLNALSTIPANTRQVIINDAQSLLRLCSISESLHVIEILKTLPIEQIRNVSNYSFQIAKMILVDKKESNIASIVRVIEGLQESERTDIVQCAKKHLVNCPCKDLLNRLNQISKLPQAIVRDVLLDKEYRLMPTSINPFTLLKGYSIDNVWHVFTITQHLFFLHNDELYYRFLTILLDIPKHHREKVLNCVLANHRAYHLSLHHLTSYLRQLSCIPENDFDQFFHFLTRIKSATNSRYPTIHTSLLEVKPLNRELLINLIQMIPLPKQFMNHRVDLTVSINALIENKKVHLLKMLFPFCECAESTSALNKLITVAMQIKDEEDLLLLGRFERIKNRTTFIASLFSVLLTVENKKRRLLMDKCNFLLSKPLLDSTLLSVVHQLNQVPENEIDEIMALIFRLLEHYTPNAENYIDSARLVSVLRNIPSQSRNQIVWLAEPYLRSVQSTLHAAKVIEAIFDCPNEEVEEIIQALNAFDLPHLFNKVRPALIRAISLFSPSERRAGIKNCIAPLLEVQDTPLHACYFTIGISLIPREERQQTMEIFRPLLCHRPEPSKWALYLLAMIPMNLRAKAVQIWQQTSDKTDQVAILNAVYKDKEICEASHEYLIAQLERQIQNKHFLQEVINFLFENAHAMGMQEEHPLFQRIVEIKAVLISDRDDLKNPFVLFHNLSEALKLPMVEFAPPEQIVLNSKVCFNLETLRAANKKVPTFTKSDWPKGLPTKGFALLFDRMFERINALAVDKRQIVLKYIKDTYLETPERLRELFLEKPLIINLIRSWDSGCDVIDPTAFYLCKLLQYIYESADEIPDDVPISDRENNLLRMSCSISECPTGLRDGIINYYNRLPLEYRVSQCDPKMGAEERIIGFVDNCLQTVMNDVFTDPQMLFAEEPLASGHFAPHRTLLLKNRLCKQVGYRHTVIFDMNSQTVHETLVKLPLLRLMQIFFNHFKIHSVINQVRRMMPEALAANQFRYMDVLLVMESLGKLKTEEYLNYFEFDEDGKLLGVTELGALRLLVASGFVKT